MPAECKPVPVDARTFMRLFMARGVFVLHFSTGWLPVANSRARLERLGMDTYLPCRIL